MAKEATGLSIAFSSGFFAEIRRCNPPSMSREALETTHMGTTSAKTFTPAALYDPGGIRVEIAHDPGADPPIDSAAETCTITYPDGETEAVSAFMTGYERVANLGGGVAVIP